MTKQLRQRLLNKKGFSYVFVCVLFLIILIITAVFIEVIRLHTVCSNVRSKFEDSLVAVATENYDKLFATAREGYTASYTYENGSWKNVHGVNKPNIEKEIMNELNKGEERQIDDIKNLKFTITQSKSNTGSRFEISGSCDVVVPFIFGFDGSLTLTVHANAQWTSQF